MDTPYPGITAQPDRTLPDRPRMTLRVSRDGGRTWGREKKFYDRNLEATPPGYVDPPCECPRHRGGRP